MPDGNGNASWAERYEAAQEMLFAADSVAGGAVFPHWIDESRLWYRRRGEAGDEYRVVDAASGESKTVLAKARLATALGAHLGVGVDPEALVLGDLRFDADFDRVSFVAYGESYAFDLGDESLSPGPGVPDPGGLVSPDGRVAAYPVEHDLWLRDLDTGATRPLTTDGTESNAYGVRPGPWRRLASEWAGAAPIEGCWSPDSKRFFTVQVDERHVPELPQLEYAPEGGGRPRVRPNRTSLAADPRVTEFRMVSIEVASGGQTAAHRPPLTAVRSNDGPFSANLAWWGADGLTAYFVAIDRGERAAHVIAFDVVTGATRTVFSEASETYLELGVGPYERALLHPLPETGELIWHSERSGHGHLYLYDLETGAEKHAITSGPWQVRKILHVDAERRELLFLAAGIAPGEDPYTCKPCLVSLDGGEPRLCSEERGDHLVWLATDTEVVELGPDAESAATISGVSPAGTFFVETVGAADRLPRTVLRRRTGEEIAVLEVADGSRLPSRWVWPQPVALVAADGATEIYGLLFKPWGHDPTRSYPVIDLIYGGPQLSHVPKSAFGRGGVGDDGPYAEAAHLAALGAFVVMIDGRGTGSRERAFRDASYGAVQTASNLEDHIAGIRQLAAVDPSIDLERVGICGFSAGGYMTAVAALRHGDFFKVAVAGGGNYDVGLFWHTWAERYHGRFEPGLYAAQAARTYASGLEGKLLLIHGMLDTACDPVALLQLVQALIEANKDYDLVVLPREGHALDGYGLRRRLDYFVTHLFDSTPPAGARIRSRGEALLARWTAGAQVESRIFSSTPKTDC